MNRVQPVRTTLILLLLWSIPAMGKAGDLRGWLVRYMEKQTYGSVHRAKRLDDFNFILVLENMEYARLSPEDFDRSDLFERPAGLRCNVMSGRLSEAKNIGYRYEFLLVDSLGQTLRLEKGRGKTGPGGFGCIEIEFSREHIQMMIDGAEDGMVFIEGHLDPRGKNEVSCVALECQSDMGPRPIERPLGRRPALFPLQCARIHRQEGPCD